MSNILVLTFCNFDTGVHNVTEVVPTEQTTETSSSSSEQTSTTTSSQENQTGTPNFSQAHKIANNGNIGIGGMCYLGYP